MQIVENILLIYYFYLILIGIQNLIWIYLFNSYLTLINSSQQTFFHQNGSPWLLEWGVSSEMWRKEKLNERRKGGKEEGEESGRGGEEG